MVHSKFSNTCYELSSDISMDQKTFGIVLLAVSNFCEGEASFAKGNNGKGGHNPFTNGFIWNKYPSHNCSIFFRPRTNAVQ